MNIQKSSLLLVGGLCLLIGITVWGVTRNRSSESTSASVTKTTVTETVGNRGPIETIAVGHDGRSLSPKQIVLQAGKSYAIEVTPERNGIGCMFAATVPTLGSDVRQIKQGQPFTINVPNAQPGKYPVVCTSMGMRQGEILVQ